MYVASDPRSALKQPSDDKFVRDPIAPAFHASFTEDAASDQQNGVRTWYARAQNFVIAYGLVKDGSTISRADQPDEYAVLLPDEASKITIDWNGTQTPVSGNHLVFVPAGDSKITVESGGQVICFYSNKSKDIIARCDALLPRHVHDTNVPPLAPWPDPVDGFKVRSYSLDIAPVEGRFGRIFRCTNFMVNVIDPRHGPRDRTKMSPHKHDTFQQISLCLGGTYMHHLRWPWETNANLWRDDEHHECGAPSATVIPAGALHTSECIGEGINQLVDIFSPPRDDFSAQDGWVLNGDEYPVPETD